MREDNGQLASATLVDALVHSGRGYLAAANLDVAMSLGELAATVARRRFTGWYAHPGLEWLLHGIGTRLSGSETRSTGDGAASQSHSRLTVLHVVTRCYSAGGHT